MIYKLSSNPFLSKISTEMKKKKKFLQEKTSGRLASVCHESTLSPAQGDISKNVTLKMEFITIILLQMNHRNL